MVSKKAESLSLETVIIFIIALIVLVLVVILFSKTGGSLFSSLRERANASIDILKALPKSP